MASRTRTSSRTALVDAAKRLLPDRSPNEITGRDLAAEAGVNYGLVHHYFGGKDAVLAAGLGALRDDFVATHGDIGTLRLLSDRGEPYLRAVLRAHLDASSPPVVDRDFAVGASLVDAVTRRLIAETGADPIEARREAQARAMAMVAMQLCYNLFGSALLEATGVSADERPVVIDRLGTLYDAVALLDMSTQPSRSPST